MTDHIQLATGCFTAEQLQYALNVIPGEFTFIDENDIIRYISIKDPQIFCRSLDNIGKDVRSCHKPKSGKMIDEMVAHFKSGKYDFAEGWVEKNSQMIYVRYSAVRNKNGKYLGILEMAADLSKLGRTPGEFGKLAYAKNQ